MVVDGLTFVIMIGLGGIAALVAFVLARDSDDWMVGVFAAAAGTAVALFAAVAGTMAMDRSVAIGLASVVAIARQSLPAAALGALIGTIWARRFRRDG